MAIDFRRLLREARSEAKKGDKVNAKKYAIRFCEKREREEWEAGPISRLGAAYNIDEAEDRIDRIENTVCFSRAIFKDREAEMVLLEHSKSSFGETYNCPCGGVTLEKIHSICDGSSRMVGYFNFQDTAKTPGDIARDVVAFIGTL